MAAVRHTHTWSGVHVPDAAFRAYMDERVGDATVPAAIEDALYLACACTRGDAAALRAFEAAFMPDVVRAIERLRLPADDVEDVVQSLREQLMFGRGGHPHRHEEEIAVMGLDASVMCSCYARGQTAPPPDPEHVRLDEDGYLVLDLPWEGHEAEHEAFDAWQRNACAHEDMCQRGSTSRTGRGTGSFRKRSARSDWSTFRHCEPRCQIVMAASCRRPTRRTASWS